MSFFIAPDTGARYDIFGSGGGKALAEKYSVPFLGEIPLEIGIRELCDEGKPPVASDNEIFKNYYLKLAESLTKSMD